MSLLSCPLLTIEVGRVGRPAPAGEPGCVDPGRLSPSMLLMRLLTSVRLSASSVRRGVGDSILELVSTRSVLEIYVILRLAGCRSTTAGPLYLASAVHAAASARLASPSSRGSRPAAAAWSTPWRRGGCRVCNQCGLVTGLRSESLHTAIKLSLS